MAHVDGEGCRRIDVACADCRRVTPIRLDPDIHAQEKAALRAEIARLYGELDAAKESFAEYRTRWTLQGRKTPAGSPRPSPGAWRRALRTSAGSRPWPTRSSASG